MRSLESPPPPPAQQFAEHLLVLYMQAGRELEADCPCPEFKVSCVFDSRVIIWFWWTIKRMARAHIVWVLLCLLQSITHREVYHAVSGFLLPRKDATMTATLTKKHGIEVARL